MAPHRDLILAVDASRLSGTRAGIDNYLFHLLPRLVRGWRALPSRGSPDGAAGRGVRLFVPPGADGEAFVRDLRGRLGEDLAGVELRAGGGPGWTQLRLPLAARGAAVYFNPIPILPQLLRMPCPAVVTVHDFHEFRARWGWFRRLLGRTFDRAARIVCVSETTEAELREEFPSAAAKSIVIREAADPALFRPRGIPGAESAAAPGTTARTAAAVTPRGIDGADTVPAATGTTARSAPTDTALSAGAAGEVGSAGVLRRLGIDTPPLLAVGTIQPRKNYATLIRAYARLPAGAPPLLIVGKHGWHEDEVLALPPQLGLEGRVVFAGHLPEAEVAELMRESLLLCSVSTAEGFGLPLVEAMACGLPILASDIPPFREVAGNAARFVPARDEAAMAAKLEELIRDGGLRNEMAAVGLRRAGLFSWDRAAEALLAELDRAALIGF